MRTIQVLIVAVMVIIMIGSACKKDSQNTSNFVSKSKPTVETILVKPKSIEKKIEVVEKEFVKEVVEEKEVVEVDNTNRTPSDVLKQTLDVYNYQEQSVEGDLTITTLDSNIKREDGSYFPVYMRFRDNRHYGNPKVITLGGYDSKKDCSYNLQISDSDGKLLEEIPYRFEKGYVVPDESREVIKYEVKKANNDQYAQNIQDNYEQTNYKEVVYDKDQDLLDTLIEYYNVETYGRTVISKTDRNSNVKRPDGTYYPIYQFKSPGQVNEGLVTLHNYDKHKTAFHFSFVIARLDGRVVANYVMLSHLGKIDITFRDDRFTPGADINFGK